MAAYAALASLMNNIEQMMKHPNLSKSFDNNQIQALLKESDSLLNIIESKRYDAGSKKAEDFERQITVAAHAAEDIIETHIVDLILAGSAGSSHDATEDVIESPMAEQLHFGSDEESLGSMVDLQRIIEEMESVMGKANEVMKMEREEREEHVHHHHQHQPTHSTLPLMETTTTAMVGLDDELEHLLGDLTGDQPNRQTISIVGMGGMGKTTLARNLFVNSLIIEHFDIRAWATVSQQYNEKEILKQLLSSLGKLSGNGSVGELGEQLYKSLIGRRYLVILDDIWSVEAWDKVRHYFPEDGSRSRVVLTTRLSDVANACGSSRFEMKLLDGGKSWKLFCENASFPHKDDPLELGDIGKKIVRSCKGLALLIVVIGGLLLKSPRTIGYWEDVAANLESIPNSKEKQESLDVLYLSYGHLPPHLKPCFLYMGVFEEDFEISVSTITRLWVAEGFIRPNGTQVLEEIAESFLQDLIDRNLILISKRRCNGEVRSCGIHDLLRDLCVNVAKQQEVIVVSEHYKIRSTDRRVVICDLHFKDSGSHFESGVSRSILMRAWLSVGSIKCKLLRVFGSIRHRVGEFPKDALHGHVNLRYLENDGSFSTSVSLLWNLQTITSCDKPFVAPSAIWKMRQLRHINCFSVYLPCPPSRNGEDESLILENLQTLATVVNLKLSEEMCKIIPNVKKLRLRYHPYCQGYNESLIEYLCNLDRLHKLESLKIQILLLASDYELHKNLAFPSSLRKLSLIYCKLHWNNMEMIGSLPRLQVLNLEEYAVTKGKHWSPAEGQFRELKFLKIENCELFEWDAEKSHFPVLEKLILIRLNHLAEIPMDIGDIPSLELIRVQRCNRSVALSAMRIKKYQQDLGNDALQIQIL